MSEWVQLDLLDAIAEAERKLKPKAELCRAWKGAVKNDNGVYVVNTRAYPAGSRKDVFLELCVALCYPYVVCELDLESTKDNSYGSYHPLCDDSMFRFSVFDDPYQVECQMTTALNARIVEDRNVSDGPRERMLKMVPQIITKAMEDMNGALE